MEFQATTIDQANVNFKAMLLFSVLNQEEETMKNVAFKFVDEKSLMQALIRTIEGSIRSFVATKKQAEILSLRTEIVKEVKQQLDHTLEGWGALGPPRPLRDRRGTFALAWAEQALDVHAGQAAGAPSADGRQNRVHKIGQALEKFRAEGVGQRLHRPCPRRKLGHWANFLVKAE